jgi:uncharacterized protein YodC (DUF2158 family)
MTFMIGDRVRSKSGGPSMIVMGIDHGHRGASVTCEWVEEGKYNERVFVTESLSRVGIAKPKS